MSSDISVGVLNTLLPGSSSSSESCDDEILEMLCEDSESEDEMVLTELAKSSSTKRNCIKNYLNDVIPPHYTEAEFRHHYKISMPLFESLSKKMEDSEDYKKMRPDKRLSAKTHIAVFLWFAGHEACSYRDVAERFNLCIASVCRVIHRTSMFLSNMAPNVIVWPSEETKLRSSKFFASKCGFNKAIGCIDGTRIVIDPPSDREDEFIDRKGNVSLSLQGICNEEKKFINVFLGHPGSCHDSWILQNSPIYSKLVSACGDFYLLGDSAYPCTQHIITPYRDNGHLTSAQKDFNITLNSGRVAIEHTFGILKQRFRQLYYCKIKGIKKLCQFIMAACVLHNIANENDFDFMNEEAEGIDDLDPQPESMQTNLIRDAIWQQMQTKSHKCNIRETLK